MKVLISEGFGAGWSTWSDYGIDLAIDKRIIKAVEGGAFEEDVKELCEDLGYTYVYMGGFDGLTVVEVPNGSRFRIKEYDGNESIEVYNEKEWILAKD